MQPATIKIFLAQGDPEGVRAAELSNWTGKALAAPRSELKVLIDRPESHRPGVYLLLGEDPETGDATLYVGEAEDVGRRIGQHVRSKDFWNAVILFISKDENLTKAHAKHLEHRIIELAAQEGKCKLMNSTSATGAALSEADQAEMDVFLEKILVLAPVLGGPALRHSEDTVSEADALMLCRIRDVTARGRRTRGGFTVFAGSEATAEPRPSASQWILSRRDDLFEKQILKPEGGNLVFTRDYEFSSPSAAAAIVHGGDANGLTAWKNVSGIMLGELEQSGE